MRRVMPVHPRANKKRLLPDVFYLRWELELLSAVGAILLLFQLPGWARMTARLIWERYGAVVNTGWLISISDILVIGFAAYIFLRLIWIFLARRQINPAMEKLSHTRVLDEVAELVISLCVIVSVVVFITFIIYLLVVLLQNEMAAKPGTGIDVYPSG